MTTRALFSLSLAQPFKALVRWWIAQAERHYLISADVEADKAREAMSNVAYYQKRAALARSAKLKWDF